MDLLKFLSSISLIILFSLAMFMFMVRFIDVNNPQGALSSTNPYINSSLQSLQNRAGELEVLGQYSQDLLTSYQPSPVYLFLIIYSAFAIPFGFLAFLIQSVGTILVILFTALFGTGDTPFYIVLGIITSIILITIVTLIIREIRTGRS